ncbi:MULTISPECIES: ATP-binding protein [unclassified Pseudovibrio]|uniref:AAA family ATPase n=1 Tax=unclassified Pseudovibrio TaxID=2627060 RepID=UPI0007AE9820|nr:MULTISPECIES: ATP-binding protein [unclassified Pseudovibrio]KZL00471.1 ATP-dependent zinc metalloprotease FtsH [Pseudovibrio sp. W74]KZL07471.1 ATP-dependent zinc metalloprotease FtsH [Pseudovibrio sp. Ad14]
MEDSDLRPHFIQLLRFAVVGDKRGATNFARKTARALRMSNSDFASEISDVIETLKTSEARAFRGTPKHIVPVDSESRHELLRVEYPGKQPKPFLPSNIEREILQIVHERQKIDQLHEAGLTPAKTLLLSGAPGVGKTMSARWLAQQLNKPLFVLDLASVMSSFLGKTGTNLKQVLDFAKREDGILLLDEFDAIAKKRDDEGEIGELKRLVTVLLQEIDLWPENQLLIAATNHSELLDPAVWRRFDVAILFPHLDRNIMAHVIEREINNRADVSWANVLAYITDCNSYDEAASLVRRTLRNAIVNDIDTDSAFRLLTQEYQANLTSEKKKILASNLSKLGYSQRKTSELTGLARETLRKLDITW